jgi:hypothetical protein
MGNKHLDQMVDDKIAGIDQELAAVDEQRSLLDARREALLAMKKALQPLRSSKQGAAKKSAKPLPSKSKPHISNGANVVNDLFNGTGQKSVNTGFRDGLKAAIRQSQPTGLFPVEVKRAMEASGAASRYSGRGDLASRIHTELYSLRKAKVVIRKDDGRYVLNG